MAEEGSLSWEYSWHLWNHGTDQAKHSLDPKSHIMRQNMGDCFWDSLFCEYVDYVVLRAVSPWITGEKALVGLPGAPLSAALPVTFRLAETINVLHGYLLGAGHVLAPY